MWRVVLYILFIKKSALSIPIESYIAVNSRDVISLDIRSVSDASPYRICAAIYSEVDDSLIAWTSVKLPFAADIKGQFQCSREYLGLLLSMFLIARAFPVRSADMSQPPITFRWVNDNTGALVWADKHKASSLASIVATMAIELLRFHGL